MEESLAAIAQPPPAEVASEPESEETQKSDHESPEGAQEPDVPKDAAKSAAGESENRIAKLTASLATMSQERAKMQQTFQNDRKKMKNDFDQEILSVQTERDSLKKERNQFEEELKEIKNMMKEQVRSMETENTASKIANRELQKQLNAERYILLNLKRKIISSKF